jgi:DNA segregation ATPase FtsK/SpoIIIE-like protein
MMEYTERQEMLYKEGVKLLRENGTASRTLFQRKLSLGYEDASFIYNRMISEGIATEFKRYTIKLNDNGGNK